MSRVIRILACAFVLIFGLSQTVPSQITAAPVVRPCDGPCHGGHHLPPTKIQYIIVIVQENRTPDNLFQGFPGADIASSGQNSLGKTVTLVPRVLATRYDLDHSHKGWKTEYDGGKMDGWDLEKSTCPSHKCLPQTAFAYVPKKLVMPYWTLAQTYTFADKTFQDNQGPSFPAHQFIIAGTSTDAVGSKLLAAENLKYHTGTWQSGSNCGGSPLDKVRMINPAGNESVTRPPCFEHPTIMDQLDSRNIKWRYYNATSSGFWSAPDAIKHLHSGPDWANVITPETTILKDIASGQLRQVSWVMPTAAESDHSVSTDGSGPAWVASVVNAVGKSKYWNSTAIFITWDDWGGWYDHVKPIIYSSYEVGFRVPLIVVSPYAKRGYVSHVQHQQSSILHFIETNFGLPTLGYADARADNLADCFNYLQSPTPFAFIPTPGWSARDLAKSELPSNVPVDDDF